MIITYSRVTKLQEQQLTGLADLVTSLLIMSNVKKVNC